MSKDLSEKQVKTLVNMFSKVKFTEKDVNIIARDIGNVSLQFTFRNKRYLLHTVHDGSVESIPAIRNGCEVCCISFIEGNKTVYVTLNFYSLSDDNFRLSIVSKGETLPELARASFKKANVNKDVESVIKKNRLFKKIVRCLELVGE